MRRTRIMLVAGEASGDANAADLVRALAVAVPDSEFQITRDSQPLTTPLAPTFFGAGGPKMAAAGVELTFDLTAGSVIGVGGLAGRLPLLLRQLDEMLQLAVARQPQVIILVDNGGFSLRLARAVRKYVRARRGDFFNWNPKIVQFISPQLWASRPGRAEAIARDYDLVLSIIPFEEKWYAGRVPQLKVEFVGNPIFDRYPNRARGGVTSASGTDSLIASPQNPPNHPPTVLLLPGSRRDEIKRHLPVMLEAARLIAAKQPVGFKMVVPDEILAGMARAFLAAAPSGINLQIGGLTQALASATMAITKTGTITLECAFFGVPAVAMYKTSFSTYFFGRYLVHVKYLSMPNLLAGEAIYPEFIQGHATGQNLAAAALEILSNPTRCAEVRAKLDRVIESLGGPGAAQRAATAIVNLLQQR
jgi:lipid-A-disaccharide synthase